MTSRTPIAVLSYNRATLVVRLLESLADCVGIDQCDVFVYCDGAKGDADLAAVAASRASVRACATRFAHVQVVTREENLGLARSVATAVGDLCDRYGRVIVLEDDFVVNRHFVSFMVQGLDRFQDAPQVAQIAGYMPRIEVEARTDALFLPLTTSCGWATWRRAWRHYDPNLDEALSRLRDDDALRHRFDLDGCFPYHDMVRSQAAQRIDSWAIRWYWSTFRRDMLTLYPRRSLVWVGGFDATATHTRSGNRPPFYDQPAKPILATRWNPTVSFPADPPAIDAQAWQALKSLLLRKPRVGALARMRRAGAALLRRLRG